MNVDQLFELFKNVFQNSKKKAKKLRGLGFSMHILTGKSSPECTSYMILTAVYYGDGSRVNNMSRVMLNNNTFYLDCV